jgi:hypothetical protein
VIDTTVRGGYHMERVGHLASVVEVGMKPGAVALMQVAGDRRDAGEEGITVFVLGRECSDPLGYTPLLSGCV